MVSRPGQVMGLLMSHLRCLPEELAGLGAKSSPLTERSSDFPGSGSPYSD